jgi:hypothetical protein
MWSLAFLAVLALAAAGGCGGEAEKPAGAGGEARAGQVEGTGAMRSGGAEEAGAGSGAQSRPAGGESKAAGEGSRAQGGGSAEAPVSSKSGEAPPFEVEGGEVVRSELRRDVDEGVARIRRASPPQRP